MTAYDQLAPHYRAYSSKRERYISSINSLILQYAPTGANSLLDVGAGDGVRAVLIAKSLGILRIVLVEPSKEMVNQCKKLEVDEILQCNAQDLKIGFEKFNLILCLWNVLGHIGTVSEREQAIQRLESLLATGGRLIFDVNNRYNSSAYGLCKVFFRILVDRFKPSIKRGDVSYEWDINGVSVPASGHLFTDKEVKDFMKKTSLKLIKQYAVDYTNGEKSSKLIQGQLFYCYEK